MRFKSKGVASYLKAIIRSVTPPIIYEAAHRVKGATTAAAPSISPRVVSMLRPVAPIRDHAQSGVTFSEARAVACSIEGMLSDFSMGVLDSVLSFQNHQGVSGHILEIGVYKGRSAAFLAARAQSTHRLILLDIDCARIEVHKLQTLSSTSVELCQASSDQLLSLGDYETMKSSFRFVHVDSSHGYRATLNELAICDELLAPRGIAVLDDYTNLNYSQILAATFKYLYTTKTDLTPFLVTEEKAYLCRKGEFDFYGEYILRDILAEMKFRGLGDNGLARTESDDEYKAFFLRPLLPGEKGPYYEPFRWR
jgi:hypothetical protein